MRVKMWRKRNTYFMLVMLQINIASMEKNLVIFLKTENISTIQPNYATSGYKPKGNENSL